MKKFLSVIGLFLTLNSHAQKPAGKPAVAAQTTVKLTNTTDSIQYIMGAYVAQWIMGNGFTITNPSLFNTAMYNVLLDRQRSIPDSLIAPLFTAYQQAHEKNRALVQEQQLFASLTNKPGVGMFPSGVRYLILQAGKGPRASETDSIVVNMIAKLPDGTVVEDTYQSKKPFDAKTNSFFPGLNEALQMMTQGSRWQLYIPAALAYGDKGTALIPANSALVIDVELVKVRPMK